MAAVVVVVVVVAKPSGYEKVEISSPESHPWPKPPLPIW
jgi:hypothetical protein